MNELRRISERYLLERQIATSEAGSLFRGTDLQSGARVVVELIRGGESAEQLQRFLETARSLRSLDHPGLPRVLDFGITHAGSAFLVTEHLDGCGLEELAGSSPVRLLALLLRLVEGLEALASLGIPSPGLAENLLVVPGPEGEQVKILGLGSAALEPGGARVPDGQAAGCHAFGLLACRLLGVQTVPTVGIPLEVAADLKDFEALRDLLEASLRGDPGGLYPSWRQVHEALRLALSGGAGRRPAARPLPTPEVPSPPAPAAPPPDRRGLLLGIGVPAAAVLLVGIAFALVLLSGGGPQPPLRPLARRSARSAVPPLPAALSPSPPPSAPQGGAMPPPLKREKPASRLVKALESGNLRSLGHTVAAISARRKVARSPEARWELARARRALAADSRLWQAEREGYPLEVIRQATALLREVPNAVRASEHRENAARGIEVMADSEIAAGELDAALYRLNGLRQVWPDRTGLAARLDRVAAERKADQDLASVLAAAARCEQAGRPFEGRQLLAGATPNRRYADRFQQARERLDSQIARLDGHPPDLTLRAAGLLYEKGKTGIIPLRITDDFGVKTVEGWARVRGGRYVKVDVRHLSGADYALDVPVDVHRNRTVEYYVVARDQSGHAGQLGSAEHPFELRRKSWFEQHLVARAGTESDRARALGFKQSH